MTKRTLHHPQDLKKRSVPTSITREGEWPDPDREFQCLVRADKLAERLRIPLKTKKDQETRVFGTACVVKKDQSGKVTVEAMPFFHGFGKQTPARGITLKALRESDDWKLSKLIESFPVDLFSTGEPTDFGSFPAGVAQPPDNEFITVMGGPFNKQLYLYDYLLMHAQCFEAKNHNPLAKAIIDTITFFTMGKGVKIQFKNLAYQEAFDKYQKTAEFQERMRTDCDSLTWAGEVMTRKTMVDGECCPMQIDPSTVWEVVTNPANIKEMYYFHRQFPTQYQLVYKPGDVSSEYIVEDIPAEEMLFLRINAVPGEKRGRSDLFSVLGWLKRFKDFYNAAIIKEQVGASYAMRKTVKGNQDDVNRVTGDVQTQTVPPPGSVIVENEAVTTDYISPTGGTSSTDNIGEAIRSIIATGVGLSPEYLGVGGKASTRATAITKGEPAAKKFEDRQMVMERWMRMEIDWWLAKMAATLPAKQTRPTSLANAKEAIRKRDWKGLIREATALVTLGEVDEEADKSYECIFPEISTEDRAAKLKDVFSAMTMKAISHQTASEIAAKELGITSYDYEQEMDTIRQEVEDKLLASTFAAPPSSFGGGAGKEPPAKPGSGASDKNYKEGKPAGEAKRS